MFTSSTRSVTLKIAAAMATETSSSTLPPEQQQAGVVGQTSTTTAEGVPNPSNWQSSGSICPFLAVISVLAILAVLSCYLGRRWKRIRAPTPLESIEDRGLFGIVRRMFRQCVDRDVEVGTDGAKVMVCDEEKHDCKVNDGEVPQQNPPQV